MKNIYKCIYDVENKKKKQGEIFNLNSIAVFSLNIQDNKIVLKSNSKQILNEREFRFCDIDKFELGLAVGGYSAAITINSTISYLYDLNIYINNQKWILEFRKVSNIVNFIEKLHERNINVQDPIGIYKIISTMDRLEIEKYFIKNSKKLQKEFDINQMRSNDRYINS